MICGTACKARAHYEVLPLPSPSPIGSNLGLLRAVIESNHETLSLLSPFAENPAWHHQGDEAHSVLDEHETAIQAEDRLPIGGRAADLKWAPAPRRVPGGGYYVGNGARGDCGCDWRGVLLKYCDNNVVMRMDG